MAAVFFAMFNVEPSAFVANNPTNPAFLTKRWIQNLSATYESMSFFSVGRIIW